MLTLGAGLSFVLPGLVATNASDAAAAAANARAAGISQDPDFTPSALSLASRPASLDSCEPKAVSAFRQSAGTRPEVFGFLPYDEDWNYIGLTNACHAIDVLLPEWFRLSPKGLESLGTSVDADDPKQQVLSIVARAKGSFKVMPVVTVADAPAGDDVHILAKGLPGAATISALMVAADEGHFAGYCLDLSGIDPKVANLLAPMIAQLDARLAARHLQSCIVVPANGIEAFDHKLLAGVDRTVVKVFRSADDGGAPEALASQARVERQIAHAKAIVGAKHLVVALGTGGVDWQAGGAAPRAVSYQQVMQRVGHYKGKIDFNASVLNPSADYLDHHGLAHKLWFFDAVTAYDQTLAAKQAGAGGVAVWGIGQEDPSFWKLLESGDLSAASAKGHLSDIALDNLAVYYGKGPLLQIEHAPQAGKRNVAPVAGTDGLLRETYGDLPLPYVVKRWGTPKPKMVALTFDDGPSAEWTPKVLKALADNGAKGTFFEIGKNQLLHPGVVRQILAQGSEVGSHTFFHPRMSKVSNYRIRTELNVQERLMATETGRRLVLFRPPYMRGDGPLEPAQLQKLGLVDDMGFIITSSPIVAPDWAIENPKELAHHVINRILSGVGQVVQMHDAGGNREATVAALPIIIQTLKAKGYSFGTVSQVLGLPTAELMPTSLAGATVLDDITFWALRSVAGYMNLVLAIGIGLGVVRVLSLLVLAHLRRRHEPEGWRSSLPLVSVLVPAYNEEKVIARTVRSLLASDYPDLEIIVIDDGSKDATARIVRESFGDDPRVRLIRQENGGKWKALNTGVRATSRAFVICVDADSVIDEQAFRRMMPHFMDPRVGGVAGNVKVGNRRNLLTRLQAVEYITSQAIDRRAFEMLNAMTVVPGAIGAWRVRALEVAGLYCDHTITEDADLTISVIRAGYRLVYEERAVSYTEAPESIGALMQQRLRWSLGMMQTAWKHRGAALKGLPVGLVALPDLVVFGVLVCLVAPLIDAVLVLKLLQMVSAGLAGAPMLPSQTDKLVLFGYVFLPLLDVIVTLSAFGIERREDRKLLWVLPFQKVFYRQVLYVTVIRAFWRALTGTLANWSKLERSAAALRKPAAGEFTGPGLQPVGLPIRDRRK